MIGELAARHRALGADPGELTIVFDAGQNSEPNFTTLTDARLHYVGSLPPSDHPGLLAIPRSAYRPVAGFDGVAAHEVAVTALGLDHRGVLTHSAELHAGQARGLDQTLAKAEAKLTTIAEALAGGRGRRNRGQLEAAIAKITDQRWVRDVLTTTITGDTPTGMRLSWHVDESARAALEDRIFGKRILITDRHDWSTAEVVAGYRSQSDAEFGFRQLKDPHVVSFSPMHHWTEQKIRVHTFYGTVTLIEICSGAVDCGAMAMDQRWGVGISGGSVERGNLTPDREALIYFGSPLGRAEPMPSWSKVRGDGAKGRQEPLGMPHRFKAFHRPFALSGGLMRVLGAIVEIPRLPVGHRPHELAVSNPVAGQFVGHQHARYILQALE